MKKMEVAGISLGIDLGTCFCCVGIWQNDRVEIIPNEMGSRTTPSYVSFDEVERRFGHAAKSMASTNSANTIFRIQRHEPTTT